MSSETIAAPRSDRQHVSADQAVAFAAGEYLYDRMLEIHKHCETCEPCAATVEEAIAQRLGR